MAVSYDANYIGVGDKCKGICIIKWNGERSLTILDGCENKTVFLEFTKDNMNLISVGENSKNQYKNCIRIWDVKKNSLIGILGGHDLPSYKVAIHQNGEFLLSLSKDLKLNLWNIKKI